jgi:hypothetical protein
VANARDVVFWTSLALSFVCTVRGFLSRGIVHSILLIAAMFAAGASYHALFQSGGLAHLYVCVKVGTTTAIWKPPFSFAFAC